MDRLALNIKILREDVYGGQNPFVHTNQLFCCEDIVIPPKTDALIPLGLTFTVPEGYILDVKLNEDLVDKSLGLIGYTFAPQAMKNEFGVMVFNYNKQSIRIEETDDLLIFNFIKVENLQVSIVD